MVRAVDSARIGRNDERLVMSGTASSQPHQEVERRRQGFASQRLLSAAVLTLRSRSGPADRPSPSHVSIWPVHHARRQCRASTRRCTADVELKSQLCAAELPDDVKLRGSADPLLSLAITARASRVQHEGDVVAGADAQFVEEVCCRRVAAAHGPRRAGSRTAPAHWSGRAPRRRSSRRCCLAADRHARVRERARLRWRRIRTCFDVPEVDLHGTRTARPGRPADTCSNAATALSKGTAMPMGSASHRARTPSASASRASRSGLKMVQS